MSPLIATPLRRDLFAALREDSNEVQGASLERTEYGHVGLVSNGLLSYVFTSYRPLQLKIYALNLSISLSAGKESNSDAPSNGE